MIPDEAKKFDRAPLGKPKPRDNEDRVQKKIAKLGAFKQPGSGSRIGKKGDHEMVAPESFLFEDKTTFDAKEARIAIGWISKITREAQSRRKVPVLVLGFERLGPPVPKDWGAVPLEVLVRLIQHAGGTMEGVDELV